MPALAARALGPVVLARVLALARRAVREARELAQAVPGWALVPGLRAARLCAGPVVAAVLVVLARVLALAQAVPGRAQVAEALPAG